MVAGQVVDALVPLHLLLPSQQLHLPIRYERTWAKEMVLWPVQPLVHGRSRIQSEYEQNVLNTYC